MRYDVIAPLDACVDFIVAGDARPEFGQKEKLVEDYDLEPGGSGTIFAAQCARMGLCVAAVGRVGQDAFGDFYRARLAACGLSDAFVRAQPGLKTGLGLALLSGEDRAMLTYLGSIDALGEDDLPRELLAQARHLHVCSPFLMTKLRPALPRVMARARALGLSVSLDTNWDPDERWEDMRALLAYCDIFMPNENELTAVTGHADIDRALETARGWVPHVIVKLGKRGARYAGRWGECGAAAHDVALADAVGAGDSFDGGAIWAFLQKHPPRVWLEAGCAAGSMSVRARGGTRGQANLDDIQALLRARGVV